MKIFLSPLQEDIKVRNNNISDHTDTHPQAHSNTGRRGVEISMTPSRRNLSWLREAERL
ncbi:hypothetical protein CY34DRAFT_802078 [Suillus luteus UH-Slu-Lm8-n1]|uniref:Uncharacterized protein n=1 Tax=Suillus luteus UH-Slu-Lm8-n1 TaxID=930992 RepID=A0A0D0A4L3_9AGAM|nr:hypothetical protein CY34DRAFT_802078 [Suillus luteus UH-Slu-Lm8-n1]